VGQPAYPQVSRCAGLSASDRDLETAVRPALSLVGRQMRPSPQHEVLFSLTAHDYGLTCACDRADLEPRHARPKRHFYFFRVRHLGVAKESGVSPRWAR
jgi:hypothetical protein